MILITPSSVVLSVGLYPWMFFNVYIQRYKNAPSKTSNKYILWPRKALVPQYIFIIYFRSIFILSTYIITHLMYIRQDPPTINKLSSIYIRRKNSNFVTVYFYPLYRLYCFWCISVKTPLQLFVFCLIPDYPVTNV